MQHCKYFLVYISLSFQSKSLRVFVTGEKLCVSTDFGPGPHTLCHPSDVAIGKWFQVHFSRYMVFNN